ncbi:MAG: phosphomannomutase, partial [Aliifodinibius sp.]|nr:phosphomannomutase [Fodinibius sp.]NIU08089.1 phosphomannomutase [Phycisphaerae bacterium]NIV10071.1 phosphomannomutase [Fodinibius sp.]NIW00562.1 phosphomannomutase [Candidatus Saccharibacteria bacterium]NIY23664.1 phosphomannomutase [Fodinibius sp.]
GPQTLSEMGFAVTELYSEPDGTFPNHHPDPTVEENLVDLQKAVKENNCEVGIAFDGDGDRIGVVDEDGNIIWGDMLVLIYALSVLEEKPGATIIGDVKCSSNLFLGIEAAGGNAIMWKTGHSLIKSKIKETDAELAGEMSGHMFFNDRFYGYDDAF